MKKKSFSYTILIRKKKEGKSFKSCYGNYDGDYLWGGRKALGTSKLINIILYIHNEESKQFFEKAYKPCWRQRRRPWR